MIKDIGNQTIDFSKIERVGAVGGDSAWLRYTVYFTGGSKLDIYETRQHSDGMYCLQMRRDLFVKMWQEG